MDNKKLLIIIGAVGFMLLIAIGLYVSGRPANQGKERFDDVSKETVYDTPDRTPETYGGASLLYLGFDNLLEYGVSERQMNGIKEAFPVFAANNKQTLNQVSVAVDTIQAEPRDRESDSDSDIIRFDVVINRQDRYSAIVEYSGISSVRLKLYKTNSTQPVFDSGPSSQDFES